MTIRISTLPNGLRLVTDPMPYLRTASIGAWIDVGSRYETAEQNGLSHMLEHMVFKGTKRRSARAIAEEIEAVGGHMNAYTSRDHTTYYVRVMREDIPLAVDMLADILQHSTFEPVEIEREREVIIQEIGQVNDTPDDIIFDLLQETAFPDQPLGRSILGTEDRVAAFDTTMVRGYLERHYCAANMVIAAAGNVDHDALYALVEAAFGSLPAGDRAPFAPGHYRGGHHRMVRPLEQTHVTLGFGSLAFDHDDYYALQVYSTLLGGGMSSRLFQEIREERGLAYSVYSFSSSHADTGLFSIYAGTGPEEVAELLPVIADQMRQVTLGVDEAELARARAQLKAGLLMSLESTSSRIEQIGRQLLIFGRVLPVEEMIARVDAVDVDAVRRVAGNTLKDQVTSAIAGPDDGMVDGQTIDQMFAA